ncbi:cell division protein SepF [Phormidesmis priestleyi ULC007]|uniref:Cell division protein SepF n=1 Tax=Phormidesmis priestleyi ULC007 TaxID=1920490 RepID=A0A2T1DHK9_9CYAN|nr:cell division protein SepF [Phormidesmis priestleyi]PSB19934.1 cell division protein SepF [Phormidesmis priestleyi ULC007]PZO50368.1 MAG: cell division protein SepF [Phormidesmis priestleyi]
MRLLRQFSEAVSLWGHENFEDENTPDFSDEAGFELLNQTNESARSPNNLAIPAIANSVQECVVLEPLSFEEIPQAVDALLAQKVLILKCAKMRSPSEAQRAVDFLAGAVYAINGHQSRIWKDVFMFAPPSVRLTRLHAMVPIQPFALYSG